MAEQMTTEGPLILPARRSIRAYFSLGGSPRKTIVLGIVVLVLLGYADVSAGPSLKLTCFYLIPAFLLTWFLGRRWGYAVAVVYALVSLAADVHGTNGSLSILLFWNAAVRFATFVVVTVMFDLCRNLTREIERLVEAKTSSLQREVKLRKDAEESIHQLASQLSAAEDAQRRRLGHDLHDTLSQNLSVLKLQLEEIMGELPADSAAQNRLGGSLSLLDALIQETRTLTFELYPSMLDDLGLVATLRRYAEQLESQTAVGVIISESEARQDLPSPVRAFLFRAVKELITNAIKHGKAREILVHIRWREQGVRIVVDDDGTGCAPSHPLNPENRTGIGLVAIAERLRFFGGTLQIESAQQQGFRALVDLPLSTPGGGASGSGIQTS
ncbi:MAG TPA: sensor histidine kinase [Phycisphaerae bacterium]